VTVESETHRVETSHAYWLLRSDAATSIEADQVADWLLAEAQDTQARLQPWTHRGERR
jgi:hypothetical protein